MATRKHCQNCANLFLLDSNEDIDEENKLCCMCWYPTLVYYQAPDEVFQALENEVKELMEGIEGDFERIDLMGEELEQECSDAYKSGGCDLCAWEKSCGGSDNVVYTLP